MVSVVFWRFYYYDYDVLVVLLVVVGWCGVGFGGGLGCW